MSGNDKWPMAPKLRFPEFVGQRLREVPLKDVTAESTVRNGDSVSTMPVMGVSKTDGIVPMEERLIASDIARYKIVQKDWFAYNPMRLNIGSIAQWKGEHDILVSPDYVVFKCLDDADFGVDSSYLNHFRQSDAWENFVNEGGDGGVRVRIYYKDLSRLRLALPCSDEQQKIADCLSSLDEMITTEIRKLDALNTHKKGLMQQIFPRVGESVPRLRFPEFQEADEWEEKNLGDVCNMQSGKFIAATEISEIFSEGLYPCFGGNGLRGYTKTFNQSGRYSLIGRQGALCGNVNLAEGNFYATEHALVTTPKLGVVTDWLFHNLNFLDLNRFATGQAQPGLSVEVLEKIACAVPKDEEEQRLIANCLSSIDDFITNQAQKIEALKIHKKGLMQKLFPVLDEVFA
ncbi:restriction endonuclease subunit S [Burkholderia pyrrocinia]|uniref:restriction endonuclease subunit S n=1 Tax=Burkholderia pyrrocinia TaxID=60550 RepID=UPI002AB14A35|nr:restriction endonuclease subunit S [Burkholderia pyrrocinia]